jgi:hypothetical protein
MNGNKLEELFIITITSIIHWSIIFNNHIDTSILMPKNKLKINKSINGGLAQYMKLH